ncbi:MAG: DUF2752 domain-containing protein [Bacteroidota bacterium]
MLEKFHLPCGYKSIFGIDCPACGSQRALDLLLQGEFFESFKMYPPLLPVLVLTTMFLLHLVNRKWVNVLFLHTFASLVLAFVMISYIIKLSF